MYATIPANDQVRPEELAGAEMLACFPPPALEQLARGAVPRTFRKDEVVFHEGDEGTSLHIVRSGLLKVLRPSRDAQLVLQILMPGQVFGELAVLNSAPRLASVIAVEPCRTIEVGKEALETTFDRYPQVMRGMLGRVARSLTLAKEEIACRNHLLEHRLHEGEEELRETQLEVIRRLGEAAESRDDDTGMHIARISRLAFRLARAAGMSAEESEIVLHAAPMHDVGKIGIPDNILLKPGSLDPHEWEIMKTHTTIGAKLLAGSRSPVVQMAELIALTHHEKWDGSGYPVGLSGEEIPLVARICAVCDVFDALVSERPYKKAWPVEDAVAEVQRLSGRHFDPRIVELFVELMSQDDPSSIDLPRLVPTPASAPKPG